MAPVCWGQEPGFEAGLLWSFWLPGPKGSDQSVVPSSPRGTFWMDLLFRAYDALTPAAGDSQRFCRAENGVVTSRGEPGGGFRHRRLAQSFLEPASLQDRASPLGPDPGLKCDSMGRSGRKEWPLTVSPWTETLWGGSVVDPFLYLQSLTPWDRCPTSSAA